MRFLPFALFLLAPLASAQASETYIEQAGLTLGQSEQDVALASAVTGEALSNRLAGGSFLVANTASVVLQGDANDVTLTQRGSGNQLTLDILGSDNLVGLLQRGTDNVLQAEILGDGNRLVNSGQVGRNNSYQLILDRVDNTEHSLRQFGDGNSAQQVVGPGMQPASIEQSGGASIIIVRR